MLFEQATLYSWCLVTGEEQRTDGAVEKKSPFSSAVCWSLSQERWQVCPKYHCIIFIHWWSGCYTAETVSPNTLLNNPPATEFNINGSADHHVPWHFVAVVIIQYEAVSVSLHLPSASDSNSGSDISTMCYMVIQSHLLKTENVSSVWLWRVFLFLAAMSPMWLTPLMTSTPQEHLFRFMRCRTSETNWGWLSWDTAG